MGTKGFQELRVYHLAERLADDIWQIVAEWDLFAKDTVGKQIVRSADSIGANIAVRSAFPKGRCRERQLSRQSTLR